MKRLLTIGMVFTVVFIMAAPSYALDMQGKLGVGIDGGPMIPISGEINSEFSFSDYFCVGPVFGAHVNYCVIPEISMQAGFQYGFMKKDVHLDSDTGDEPYFSVPQIYLDGVLNLGSFFNNPDNAVNPYIKAGVGLYFWKITEDGAGGDAVMLENDEEFKKTSFGLNGGLGVEYFQADCISIFIEGNVDYFFTKDEDKFGSGFSNLGDLTVKAGFSYYFPLNGK